MDGTRLAYLRLIMAQRAQNFDVCSEPVLPEALIFGSSAEMSAVRRNLLKVADTNLPILLEGESGTGKEVICKYLHRNSIWGKGPLLKVSCPAVPATVLVDELFGLPEAQGEAPGTLFLDEVGELDSVLQGKLLRMLQDGHLQSGSNGRGGLRVICSTSRRLHAEVATGRFRQDLYYRLSGLAVRLPALRERMEDIDALVEYFRGLYNELYGRSAPPLSPATLSLMTTQPWSGNIRELENLIRRYAIVGSEEDLVAELGGHAAGAMAVSGGLSLSQMTRNATRLMESRIILDTLRANQWNRRRTARALKISYRSLMYKLKRTGIQHGNQAGAGSTS